MHATSCDSHSKGILAPDEALRLVLSRARSLEATSIPLRKAVGYILAEDLASGIALPSFDNSAMDGFALRSELTLKASREIPIRLDLATGIKAGDAASTVLKDSEVCKIMTGAPLPEGADCVLPKENAEVVGNSLWIRTPIPCRSNVRKRGEEISPGDTVLKRGQLLQSGTIGIAASIGADKLSCVRKPRVAVLSTGNELVEPGKPLRDGSIYNSNGAMLAAALDAVNIPLTFEAVVRDEPAALERALADAMKLADLVVVTGGVSVGDFDFTSQAFQSLGVDTVFWKVAQKPGKPLLFGTKGTQLVFGLPGNPAAVFTCFYLYVYPALRVLQGVSPEKASLPRTMATLTLPMKPDHHRTTFLKAAVDLATGNALPLPFQASHTLRSLADANALIELPPVTALADPQAMGKLNAYLLP